MYRRLLFFLRTFLFWARTFLRDGEYAPPPARATNDNTLSINSAHFVVFRPFLGFSGSPFFLCFLRAPSQADGTVIPFPLLVGFRRSSVLVPCDCSYIGTFRFLQLSLFLMCECVSAFSIQSYWKGRGVAGPIVIKKKGI